MRPPEAQFTNRLETIHDQILLRDSVIERLSGLPDFKSRLEFTKDFIETEKDRISHDNYRAFTSFLNRLKETDDLNEFVSLILPYLRPILEDFQSVERMRTINDLLGYTLDTNKLQLHVSPNESPLGAKLKLLRDGLKKAARIVENNPRIKYIEGDSWIVYKNPGLLEKLGFSVSDFKDDTTEITVRDDKKGTHRVSHGQKTAHAEISREEFLKRYL